MSLTNAVVSNTSLAGSNVTASNVTASVNWLDMLMFTAYISEQVKTKFDPFLTHVLLHVWKSLGTELFELLNVELHSRSGAFSPNVPIMG